MDDLAAAAGHSGRTWREAERVLALFIESFVLWQKFGLSIGIASGLTGFAALAQTKGQFVRAARLWGAAAAVRASAEACLAPLARAEYDRFTAALRAQLGDAAFASAWVEGRALTAEKAVAYALAATSGRVLPSSDPEAPQETRPGPLSAREREVLRLIADGLSNREIAHHLVMAVGTIKWYTGQIYSKLGARGRTQAIALARASGLLP